MSVGVPGSFRSLDWRGRYSPELIAAWLPTVWGHAPWLTREPSIDRCRRGPGDCSHICDEDQWDEGCTVDGDHKICQHRHGGHDQCGRCACIDPTSRRATSSRDPDTHVIAMDMTRAWNAVACGQSNAIGGALYLRHRYGYTQEEIAATQGVSRQAVSLRLRAGHLALTEYLNGEHA